LPEKVVEILKLLSTLKYVKQAFSKENFVIQNDTRASRLFLSRECQTLSHAGWMFDTGILFNTMTIFVYDYDAVVGKGFFHGYTAIVFIMILVCGKRAYSSPLALVPTTSSPPVTRIMRDKVARCLLRKSAFFDCRWIIRMDFDIMPWCSVGAEPCFERHRRVSCDEVRG
jgi:hypothetical protein